MSDLKIKVTFKFLPVNLAKLKHMAFVGGTTQTEIIETLIERAPEIMPKTITIRSFSPWTSWGEAWEGKYTGPVEVTFPPGIRFTGAGIWVEGKTFDEFHRDLIDITNKLREV